jgi:hypothetical protein
MFFLMISQDQLTASSATSGKLLQPAKRQPPKSNRIVTKKNVIKL